MIQLPIIPWAPAMSKYRDRVHSGLVFAGDNDLEFPDVAAETWEPEHLVAFNDPRGYRSTAAMHFFIDDYRFEPVWVNPAKYVDRFTQVGGLLTPDFSCFRGMPIAVAIWQVYRARWMGAYWQSLGFRVIPTVSWAEPADFYFWGLPKHGVLAVATTGIRGSEESIRHFCMGFERLYELNPTRVLVYGGIADLMTPDVPVIEYPAFLDMRRQAMEDN